jgi:hypothetical protein
MNGFASYRAWPTKAVLFCLISCIGCLDAQEADVASDANSNIIDHISAGHLSAEPEVCVMPEGATSCTSTIAWESDEYACVFVRGTAAPWRCGFSGTESAPWISAQGVNFDLRKGSDEEAPLISSVFVTARSLEETEIDFHRYDEVNVVPEGRDQGSYTLVNNQGVRYADIYITKTKDFSWLVAPVQYQGSRPGVWYRSYTAFNATNPNCAPQQEIQVAHRYLGQDGTVWEMGGQPHAECGDHTFNVYADKDQNLEPIIMAPSSQTNGQTFYSEFWQAPTPYNHAPEGYPNTGYLGGVHEDFVLSKASIVEEHERFEVNAAGRTKTYEDVIEIFWLHGTKHIVDGVQVLDDFPCGDQTPDRYKLRGWNVYGRKIWFARHMPGVQTGGIVKDELEWYCQRTNEGPRATGTEAGANSVYYRKWW